MTRYGMVIDLERCVGCYACVVSCKQYFGTRPGIDYNQAKIAEWGAYPKTRRQYISLMCNHCEEPPCLISCPTGSTYKSPEGPVLTDPEKCDGCGTCVKACPYGQRFLSTKDETYFPGAPIPAEIESAARIGKAEKCTLCQERLKQGLEPICVALCPGGCRIFGDLADPESEINYYINLYGAVKIGGTSLYYVLPKGMDPALLPHGYDPEAGVLRETTAADAVGPRRTPEDPDYRQLMDGLIKARDWIRKNDDRKPDIGGEYKYTYCAQCSQMPRCGVKAVVKDGKVIRVERREEYGNELLCAIGNAAVQDLYAPDRLLHPMRRTNPKGEPAQWKRIGWDEAIREISEKLNGIKEKYGPEKVLFMTGDPKEPRSAMQRLAYTFGSPNFGTESSTCYTATELATRLIYGLECRATIQMRAGVADINETKVVLIWACNPAISGVPGYDRMKTAREYSNTKYIVIDPRATETVEQFADIHIPLRAGTDGALALFFANWLIARGAYDKAFVREWAHGFDEYRALAAGYTLERTARICGVPEALLEEAADTLVREGAPIAVRASSSVCQQTNGINTYRAIQLLVPLTGSLDVEGGHLAADEPLGLDMWGATYAFSRVHELLPKLKHLRVDTPYFPVWAGTDIDGSLQLNALPEYVKAGALRVCLMLGGNCMMWPQSHEYQEAFRDMEFVAAADLRIRPATHDYVDMVLPAAMSFERAAPFSVTGRKIFLREPIVPPAGEARSDYRICCDIGAALGYEKEFWGGGENAEEACLREILRTVGGANEVTLEMLRAASPDGVAARMKQGPRYKKYELGLLREDGQPGFETPSGKVEFASEVLRAYGFDATPVFREPTYSPVSRPELAAAYPLVMNAGSRVPFFCHSKERTLPWLRRFMPNPVVRVCRKDAEDRALREGDWVRVTSPVNPEGIVAKLEVTNIVRPGSIDMFHGWIEANVNELVPRDFDPISGFPPYREGLCQIEKSVKSEEEGQVPA